MTTEIEKTKRALYGCLDRIRRAGKHRKLTAEFEERLEEHLEELRKEESAFQARIGELYSSRQQWEDIAALRLDNLSAMTEERDQIQQRLHAIDHAYNEQQKAMGIAGEELRNLQTVVGANRIEIESFRRQVEDRDLIIKQQRAKSRDDVNYLNDCITAEKLSDTLGEKLRDAQAVIGRQEQLIVGQRLAIADLYLAGRRVNSAVATLQRLGYTDCGGQLWKPPLGKKPHFDDWCTDPMCDQCRAKCGGR